MFGNRKTLVLLIAMLLLVTLLVSCNKTDTKDTTAASVTTEAPTTTLPVTAPISPEHLMLVEDGKAVRIVYGNKTPGAKEQAEAIAQRIKTVTGATADVATDRKSFDEEYDSSTTEILIGNTAYSESAIAYSKLHYGQYGVICVGNKVTVVAYDQIALEKASGLLEYLIRDSKDANKNVKIDGDYSSVKTSAKILSDLPIYEKAMPETVVKVAKEGYQVVHRLSQTEAYDEYQKKLTAVGFEQYDRNELDNNIFTTYKKGDKILTSILISNKKYMFNIVESLDNTALPAKEPSSYEKVCDTTLTQLGLYYDTEYYLGFSYVMRLADGSFILFDGGYGTDLHADNLYNTLKKQAPDPDNIVISAWVLSHPHGDHVPIVGSFGKKYGDKVTVKSFIYNFADDAQCAEKFTHAGPEAESSIKKYYKDATVYRALAGQEYYIVNAKLTVFYSGELYSPDLFVDHNDSCLGVTVEADGVKTMVLGDIVRRSAYKIIEFYSKAFFKSDIMQLPHHGIPEDRGNLYKYVDPSYVFWPLGGSGVHGSTKIDGKFWEVWINGKSNEFIHTSKNIKEMWMANDDVVVLTLKDGSVTSEVFEDISDYIK